MIFLLLLVIIGVGYLYHVKKQRFNTIEKITKFVKDNVHLDNGELSKEQQEAIDETGRQFEKKVLELQAMSNISKEMDQKASVPCDYDTLH